MDYGSKLPRTAQNFDKNTNKDTEKHQDKYLWPPEETKQNRTPEGGKNGGKNRKQTLRQKGQDNLFCILEGKKEYICEAPQWDSVTARKLRTFPRDKVGTGRHSPPAPSPDPPPFGVYVTTTPLPGMWAGS